MNSKNPYKQGQVLVNPEGQLVRVYQSNPAGTLTAFDLESGQIRRYEPADMKPAESDSQGIEAHRSAIVLIGYAASIIEHTNWQLWHEDFKRKSNV